jgi:hypothetical protein
MDIDLMWSAEGRAAAQGHRIAYAEVVDIVDARTTIQVRIGDGPAQILFLGERPGRVFVVTADRQARTVAAYDITDVRPATGGEVRAWEKRQP